jgi:hypothetical protein
VLEDVPRATADVEKVLRDALDPTDIGRRDQPLVEVGRTKPDAVTERRRPYCTAPLILSHSALEIVRTFPLQLFLAAHPCFCPAATPAQDAFPLHEFASLHCTVPDVVVVVDAGSCVCAPPHAASANATVAASPAPLHE